MTREVEVGARLTLRNLAGFKAEARSAQESVAGIGRATEVASAKGSLAMRGLHRVAGAAWTGIKYGAIGTAVALGGAAIAATKFAGTFQQQMELIHTQAGGSQRDVAVLSKQILGLRGVEQTPIELAQAMYHLKSVGLDNVAAMQALRVSSELAAVGQAGLEDTTNAVAGAWRSGIRGAEDFGKTAGMVNAIVGAGNMRMTDFTSALSTGILPAARTAGVSLQDVGAALAVLTANGVPANSAATRLRMTFSLMAAPSASASKMLKSIGIGQLDLANTMRGPKGLVGALQLLQSHLAGLDPSKRAYDLSKIFGGGRSSSAILTLLNNLDVVGQKYDQIGQKAGAFSGAVTAQQRTAAGRWAQLKAAGSDALTKLGAAIMPVATKVLPMLTKALGPVIRAIGPPLTRLIGTVGRILPSLLTAAMPIVNAFAGVFAALATAMAPVLQALGPILQRVFRQLMPAIQPVILALGRGLLTIVKALGPTLPQLARSFAQILIALAPLIPPLAQIIALFARLAGPVIALVARALAWVVTTVIAPLVRAIAWLADHILPGLAAAWQGLWHGVSAVVHAAWAVVKPVIDAIITAVMAIVHAVQKALDWLGKLNPVNWAKGVAGAATSARGGGSFNMGAAQQLLHNPNRQAGGPVHPHRPVWVGESGRELFVSGFPGTIVPTTSTGSGAPGGTDGAMASGLVGPTVIFHPGAVVINESGDPQKTLRAVRKALADELARA